MKFVKTVNGKKIVIEDDNKNHFSMYIREGFKEEKKKTK